MDLVQPTLTKIGNSVLKRRYLKKDEYGNVVETPKEMFERVAKHVAQNDEKVWPVYYDMMARKDFLPNTPCLVNAGRLGSSGELSACHVYPIDDSMESILDTMKHMAITHQHGAGSGFAFSSLRPAGDIVGSTSGVASGPISFMHAFDRVTDVIKQGGVRRGANMATLRCDHSDILDFIDCKLDTAKLTNFNISVAVTDVFMIAVENDEEYALVNPRTGRETRRIRARDVWKRIARNAHATGEPGLFFVDRVNRLDPLSGTLGKIASCNPCGEVPARPYDACTLGSINLSNFFIERDGPTIDFDRLAKTVKVCVRFLDDVLEVNEYPVKKTYEITRQSRKIGLGVMGWADLLIKLGIPYASDEAVRLAEQVMQFINTKAIEASEHLAEDRGPFPAFDDSRWAKEGHRPRRNSTSTVIAPTGSISTIAGCSSGIEPLFALCVTRKQADMVMVDVNPLFVEVAKRDGFYSDALIDRTRESGTVSGDSSVPDKWQSVFTIANEIDAEYHVRMQAAFQKHTQDAVSKTVNLPRNATVDDVNRAYQLAWDLGCKGITVYRDGCREGQTFTIGAKKEKKEAPELHPKPTSPCDSKSHDIETPAGNLHVELRLDNGRPLDVWLSASRAGTVLNADTEAVARLSSLILRMASPIDPMRRLELIADQLADLGGGDSVGFGPERVLSLPDGVAKALRKLAETLQKPLEEGQVVSVPRLIHKPKNGNGRHQRAPADVCPECHQISLVHSEGCVHCALCHYSRC